MFAAFLGFVIGWCVRGLSGRVRREHRPRLTSGAWVDDCCRNGHLRAPEPDRGGHLIRIPCSRPPPTGLPGPGVPRSR